jgi:predicted RNA-binding Zn-ribbon protein involved in translation (DUF1610 family)
MTQQIVTAASVRPTLDANGYACPRCGAGAMVETSRQEQEGAQYQQMCCDICGMRWTNVWTFARALIYGQGDDPDTFALPVETLSTPPLPDMKTLPKVRTDPDLWTQDTEGTWQKTHAPRTLDEVWDDIAAALPAYGVDLELFDYAGPIFHQEGTRLFPQEYRWLTCFGVRGASEGWYAHVVAVHSSDGAPVLETLYLAKTFVGWEATLAFVHAVTQMLDA